MLGMMNITNQKVANFVCTLYKVLEDFDKRICLARNRDVYNQFKSVLSAVAKDYLPNEEIDDSKEYKSLHDLNKVIDCALIFFSKQSFDTCCNAVRKCCVKYLEIKKHDFKIELKNKSIFKNIKYSLFDSGKTEYLEYCLINRFSGNLKTWLNEDCNSSELRAKYNSPELYYG